ncbi:hypothetical protein D3C76_1301160 [compost metagenome]
MGGSRLDREEHSGDIDVEDVLKQRRIRAAEWRTSADACIGEHDIYSAECFYRCGDGFLRTRWIRCI